MITKSYLKCISLILIILSFFIDSPRLTVSFAEDEVNSVHTYLLNGHSFHFQGYHGLAIEEYKKVLEKNPDNFQAYVNMGLIYRDMSLYNKAIDAYNKAIAINNKEPIIFLNLGWAYYNISDFDKAKESFQKAVALVKEAKTSDFICEAHFGLGSTYIMQKLYDKAKEEFNEAIQSNSNYTPAYFRLGMVYEAEEQIDEAIINYLKVLKVDYNFVEVRFYLARLYLKQKLYEKAFAQYDKISNFDSQNSEALEKKKEILVFLAKKPEEIIAPKRIAKNKLVNPAPQRDNIPLLRIGIGVDKQGNPLPKEKIFFKCGAPFIISDKNKKSNIAEGKKDEIWRIELKEDKKKFFIYDPQNLLIGEFNEPVLIKLSESQTNTIIIQNIGYGKGFPWGGEEDREYRGEIEINLTEKYDLQIVNIVNIEEYLYSVLSSEMSTYWPSEALKAQAIIARGEALYKQKYIKPHRKNGYDLCDDQNCQVYRGIKTEDERSVQAVNATRGEVLFHNDKVAHTLYSANCGGHTQSSHELTGWGDEPYLQGVLDAVTETSRPDSPFAIEKWIKATPDVHCNLPKLSYPAEFRWVRIIKREDLEERINRLYKIGKVVRITPLKRSKSGHINSIKIKGEKGEIILDREHNIRNLLAGGFLRSTLFVLETRFGKDNMPVEWTLYGGGWGHAVGMCQTGAAGMASKLGLSYKEILYHYYKDTQLKRMEY